MTVPPVTTEEVRDRFVDDRLRGVQPPERAVALVQPTIEAFDEWLKRTRT